MEKAKIELQNISKNYYSEAAFIQALHKINLLISYTSLPAVIITTIVYAYIKAVSYCIKTVFDTAF